MRKLFQTQCLSCFLPTLIGLIVLLTACSDRSYSSPQGYNLKKPIKRELGKSLNEISGLYFSEQDTSLLSISDSKRKVFQIHLTQQKLKDYAEKFYEQADFEDVVKLDSAIYVLISNGTILQMPLHAKDSAQTIAYPFWSSGKNDFETLYHDPSEKSLIMICKQCEDEKGEGVRTAYRFDLQNKSFDSTIFYQVKEEAIKSILKKDDADFKPSAAAIHPITKNLFILSSAGQLLAVTDTRGKVLEAYNLNPDLFPQAEGIAFSPNGTMYISNEGKYGKPTLLVFPYQNTRVAGKKNN